MGAVDRPWSFTEGTQQVADFVRGFEIDTLPDGTRSTLERTVIDTLGAIHAGHSIHETELLTEYVGYLFTDGEATILNGTGATSSLEGAVFANSIAANALDSDEGNRYGDGHPAAMIVPVALGAAEAEEATIGEFLAAVLVGYEVAVEAGHARRKIIEFHSGTGSWAPVGAAAAVARLQNLDQTTLQHALGIADFNAPITPVLRSVANPGSGLTKDGVGWGGFVGTSAVELASRGLTGSGTVFDHNAVDSLEGLGDGSSFDHQYVKPYPTCRWTHAGIDAVRDLYSDHEIDPSSIESVDLYSFEHGVQLGTRNPTNADEAEYSYPYSLAVALVYGDVTPAALRRESLEDENISAMIDRIDVHFDPDLEQRYDEAWMARVDIHTDSNTYSSGVTYPRGSTQRPMTDSDFDEKFRHLFSDHPIDDIHEQLSGLLGRPESPISDLIELWR